MVFFSQIQSAVAENKEAAFHVSSFSLKGQQDVDIPSLQTKGDIPVPTRSIKVQTVVDSIELPPMPTRSVTVHTIDPPLEREIDLGKPGVRPGLSPPKPTQSVQSLRIDSDTSVIEPSTQRAVSSQAKKGMDPISIGMSLRDPMYEIATKQVKQTLEAEETQRLESQLDGLYKSESGRSRGWVKTHLTAFLLPRAASGSFVSAKEVFSWEDLQSNKKHSAIFDFVCLAKGIRVAVWYENTKEVFVWPAADSTQQRGAPPLFHFSTSGSPLRKQSVLEEGWTLRPPFSVEHSLEKLTIGELAELAQKLGIPEPSGKKADYIKQIASERTKLRFRNHA
jgi:hypothetical protein